MISRHGISSTREARYKRFHLWLVEMSTLYGVVDDPELRDVIHILLEKLENRISANKEQEEGKRKKKVRSFFAIFKQKYLQLTDLEYFGGFKATEAKIIEGLIGKLEQNGATMEEYLKWLFDEFYINKEQLSPNIPLSVSNSVLQEFMYKNAAKLKNRKQAKEAIEEEELLLRRAGVLIRSSKDEGFKQEVVTLLKHYQKSECNLPEFRLELKKLSEKFEKLKSQSV